MSLIKIDWNPGKKALRQFGLTMLIGLGVVGVLLAWKWGSFSGQASWTGPFVLWGIGVAMGLFALLAADWLKPAYLLWMGLAFPIGWLMSHLFLLLVYFGIFTPVALFFRLVGRDVLRRRKRNRNDSYWIARRSQPVARRYFRQF
ncbi:MAG: hypothetical protein JSU96_08835 [Acidobacteriota bacterium]|nr:MAG: hypothetical protein JSU96_08835 [Acidobacteriota bacterium]